MRPKLLLLGVFVVCVAFAIERTMAVLDDSIDIDGDTDYPVVKKSESGRSDDSYGSEGDDEDDEYGSGTVSDESGSGSGEESTTDSSVVDVSVVSPTTEESAATTEQTTEIPNEITDSTEKSTEDTVNVVTDEPTDGESVDETEDDSMFGGGISETDSPNEGDEPSEKDSTNDQDSPNAEARIDEKTGSVLRVLTTEVIAAVVVGAVCAVILIAFLVYRLRKRDEGSYALSDAGYKDTYKLQGDTGKEAFV